MSQNHSRSQRAEVRGDDWDSDVHAEADVNVDIAVNTAVDVDVFAAAAGVVDVGHDMNSDVVVVAVAVAGDRHFDIGFLQTRPHLSKMTPLKNHDHRHEPNS